MPRTCKICKTKFEPKYNSVQMCCSWPCALEYAKKEKDKNLQKLNSTKSEDVDKRRRKDLQTEINRLAKMVDRRFKFKCIDCENDVHGTGNGAHYHNVGGNENIRYNLHNISLARIHCNKYSSEHKKGYVEGLIKRYGQDYYEYVETGLNLTYKEMHFTKDEIKEALKITRKIIRDFGTFQLTNPILAKDLFNSMIGLYKIKYWEQDNI